MKRILEVHKKDKGTKWKAFQLYHFTTKNTLKSLHQIPAQVVIQNKSSSNHELESSSMQAGIYEKHTGEIHNII